MKSIMEEASTISKAIENAWQRAGTPQEFSVKVLELPQTTFFGLKTSKSAKVALFFNEQLAKKSFEQAPTKPARSVHPRQPQQPMQVGEQANRRPQNPNQQPRTPQPRPERVDRVSEQAPRDNQKRTFAPRHDRNDRPEQPQNREFKEQREPRRYEPRSFDRPQESRESWSPEMVEHAQEWVKETLVLMGKPEIEVAVQPSHNYLKISLSQPVLSDERQEETQLKSWGSLAMEAVREKAHKPLRGLRIVIDSKK